MKQSILNKLKLKYKNSSIEQDDYEYLWLKQNCTRDEAEYELKEKSIGVFIIRKSETVKNCYVLSVKVPIYIHHSTISHYLIECNKKAFKIRGCTKQFPSLCALVVHCSMIRDCLPIVLNIDYYNKKYLSDDLAFYSSGSSIASSVYSESSSIANTHDEFEF